MKEEQFNSDLAKEFLAVISFCDSSVLNKLPDDLLKKISDLAADSTKDFYLDKNKKLDEQNITEECKDLIGTIFFMYLIDENEKTKMLDIWLNNEKDSNN